MAGNRGPLLPPFVEFKLVEVFPNVSSTAPLVSIDLKQLASDVLSKALKAGATDAEAVIYEGDEFSALVHLGQVETLKESGSRAVGLRVFIGQHTASTSSSDFSDEGVSSMARSRLQKSRTKTPLPDCPKRTTLANSTATSISTSTTSTQCRQPSASKSHAAPRPPPWLMTPASRTPAEATSIRRPRTRS